MNRGWPAHVRSVQPGGGPVANLAALARAWRRSLLRTLRPGYTARFAAARDASCPACPHGVLDARDLLWVKNVCTASLPATVDPFRDRFGLVRLARPDIAACFAAGILAAAALWFVSPWLAVAPLLLPLFALWFFRDPHDIVARRRGPMRVAEEPQREQHRTSPAGDDVVLAPADGLLDDVRHEAECPFFAGPAWRLGIYLSLFDVHVNRAPVRGTAERFDYRRGARGLTKHRESADRNEQLVTWFRAAANGEPVVVRQIAGPAARRICNVLGAGDVVAAGQRFGLIKFGSRTELWLPAGDGVRLAVADGQRVIGGVSVLARFVAVTGAGSGSGAG